MFWRVLRRGLSPAVQVPRHRLKVICSIGELVCLTLKAPPTNLQPFLPQIRELIIAEGRASYFVTSRLLVVTLKYFRKDNAVQGAVMSLLETLARQNKTVSTGQNNACRFISDCGQLRDVMPASTCDYLSTIVMKTTHMTQNASPCLNWINVLHTFARASYDPASPAIKYIVKKIILLGLVGPRVETVSASWSPQYFDRLHAYEVRRQWRGLLRNHCLCCNGGVASRDSMKGTRRRIESVETQCEQRRTRR